MRTLAIALTASAVALAGTASASADGGGTSALYGGYRYSGRRVCAAESVVTLKAAAVYPGKWSHAAVWSGVYAAGSEAWVQAGVTEDPDGAAYAYLEWSTVHGQYRLVRLGDATSLRVRLAQHGSAWTLTVGQRSATVRLGAQTRCFVGAESEDWSQRNLVRGTVSVDGGAPFGVNLS